LMSSNNDYLFAYTVIPIISLAFVFKGMQYVFSLAFHFTKKTSYNAYIVITISLLNVLLNFLFIPLFGYLGAAYSMLLSMFIMMMLSYYYANKLYKIEYEIRRITILIILGILIYFISIPEIIGSISFTFVIKVGLFLLFPILLLAFNFFDNSEMIRINEWLQKVKRK